MSDLSAGSNDWQFTYELGGPSPCVCPVCNGATVVECSRYPDLNQDSAAADFKAYVPCRSCEGKGILWPPQNVAPVAPFNPYITPWPPPGGPWYQPPNGPWYQPQPWVVYCTAGSPPVDG